MKKVDGRESMSRTLRTMRSAVGGLLCSVMVAGFPPAFAGADAPIRVFATLPDLGSLAKEVGGDAVSVVNMVEGSEDPHFAPARPSWIKELSKADVYVQVGMELEMGYASVLLQNARNRNVLPGNSGYIDASTVITPLEVPAGPVDRSMGDVHPFGNPHYLLDPINGLKVARLLRDRFREIRPGKSTYFDERFDDFRRRIGVRLVGADLAAKYDAEKLARLYEFGKLAAFLEKTGETDRLGGWLGQMAPVRGAKVVDDHRLWPYFGHRFGIEIIDDLEPKPGVPPTTAHLTQLVEVMRNQGVKAIITSPYYDPRHARFLSEATGATIVPLSHQVGGRPGTGDYLGMIDYNVQTLVGALRG
jgi:ABC-type Zn uptake system ZnuABC Zn-binding protein ZnuA